MSATAPAWRGSLAVRLVGLFTLGTLGVFALLGASLVLMLRSELRGRDLDEIDSKTTAIEHHLIAVRTRDDLKRSVPRFVDTAVGHAYLQLGLLSDGEWLLEPSEVIAGYAAARPIDSIPASPSFETLHSGGRTWWIRRVPYRLIDEPGAVVNAIVAVDVSHATRVQDRFNVALLMIGTTGIVLMATFSWWATRRGLAPLERVASDAQRVTAERLGEPLSIEQAPDEVRGVVEAINRMLGRLQGSFESLEQFSADIAHELRTPLSSLKLQTEVTLSRERSADDYREALLGSLQEIERLQKMVSDMLFIARAERGMASVGSDPVDLRSETLDVIEYFEPLASERRLSTVIEGTGTVFGDRAMIRRAITNLLSNAVRYSVDGSEITVRIAENAGTTRLTVGNRCEPISQSQIDHLFDRFARGDAARDRQPDGSGLGLAIVRSIMNLHRGSVTARPLDEGLEVELSWPQRAALS